MTNINEIKNIQAKFPEYTTIDCFVETGTYKGCTVNVASTHFKELHTIELCENLHRGAIERAAGLGIKNINFIRGDSADELPNLTKSIKKPVVFFLDGHFCGTGRGSVRSEKGNPIFKELQAINERNYNDVVIVDDVWLFGKEVSHKELDWKEVTTGAILDTFDEGTVKHYFVRNDRFVIYLKERQQE